jgi:hypothetical protein
VRFQHPKQWEFTITTITIVTPAQFCDGCDGGDGISLLFNLGGTMGWQALVGEFQPNSIGAELAEME